VVESEAPTAAPVAENGATEPDESVNGSTSELEDPPEDSPVENGDSEQD
jgi:hypothetical protein